MPFGRIKGAVLVVAFGAVSALPQVAVSSGRTLLAIQPDATALPRQAAGIEGRWELGYEVPTASGQRGGGAGRRGGGSGPSAGSLEGGRGRGGSPTAGAGRARGARGGGALAGPDRSRILLNLRPAPANTLTGTATAVGAGGIGGNAPGSQAVEISNGQFDGTRVSFEVWTLDGFRNRTRYEGQLEGSALRLTLTRETATGPETIAQATAARLPY